MSNLNTFASRSTPAQLRAELAELRDMQKRADDRYDAARTDGERTANAEISRYAMREIDRVVAVLNGW